MTIPGPTAGRRVQLIAAARQVLESEGAAAVTMRRLGAEIGMRGPSIYKHFPDKASIQTALAVEVFTELTGVLERVPATFIHLALAYRAWALDHPHLHLLINDHLLDRAGLPAGLEESAAAPLVTACKGDRSLARAAWATIKGLVDLELAERFGAGTHLDAVYEAAARAYDAANSSR